MGNLRDIKIKEGDLEEIFVEWKKYGYEGFYSTREMQEHIKDYQIVFDSAFIAEGDEAIEELETAVSVRAKGYKNGLTYSIIFMEEKSTGKLYLTNVFPPLKFHSSGGFLKDAQFVGFQCPYMLNKVQDWCKEHKAIMKKNLFK